MTRSKQAGFTIVEALIAMTVFLALLTAVISVYAPSRSLYVRGERRADAQQNARLALAEMVRQIRMAGYFPENLSATPPTPALADPVLLATDAGIALHGDTQNQGTSNAVFFCLDGSTLRRSSGARDVNPSYTCTAGEALAENVTGLRFTYYDAAGDPVPDPPTGPFQLDSEGITGVVPGFTDLAERGSVRRVVVTLTVSYDNPDGSITPFSLSSEAWLRNN